jgi:hypothetical protein
VIQQLEEAGAKIDQDMQRLLAEIDCTPSSIAVGSSSRSPK